MGRLLLSAAVFGLLAGCGGGGSGGSSPAAPATGGGSGSGSGSGTSNAAPEAALVYPAPSARTSAATIDVVLQITDAEGDAITRAQISAGGTTVTATQESGAVWRATNVPLAPGENALQVTVEDAAGSTGQLSPGTVISGPVLPTPAATTFDAASQTLYVYDNGIQQIVAIDPADASIEVIANLDFTTPSQGNGNLVLDQVGRLLLLRGFELLRIDPQTRVVEIVHNGSGIQPGPFAALALDVANDVAWLFSAVQLRLWRLDLAFPGAQPEAVGAAVPGNVLAATFDASAGIAYSVSFTGELRSWDVATGASAEIQTGVQLNPPTSVVWDEPSAELLLLAADGSIRALDPTTLASRAITASSPAMVGSTGLALSDSALWLASPSTGNIFRIDRATATADRLVTAAVGSGPMLDVIAGAHIAADGAGLIVQTGTALLEIDFATGERTQAATLPLPSGLIFGFLALAFPGGFDLSDDTTAWSTNLTGTSLLRSDLGGSAATVIADANTGTGPALQTVTGIAVAPDGATVWVSATDNTSNRVLQVDPTSGDRTLLWSDSVFGSGHVLRDLHLDAPRNRLLLDLGSVLGPSSSTPVIMALDLTSLTLTTLADLPSTAGAINTIAPHQGSIGIDGDHLYTLAGPNAPALIARTPLASGVATDFIGGSAAAELRAGQPAIVVAGADERLYMLDFRGPIYQVDVASGARVLVAR